MLPFRVLKVESHLHTKLGKHIRMASPIQAVAMPVLRDEQKPDAIIQAPTGIYIHIFMTVAIFRHGDDVLVFKIN